MGFIDQMRSEGHAVESIIRVLREQGVKIAARTYRAWRQGRITARTVTDALVIDAVRDAAWTTVVDAQGMERRKMTPEGLYGRKKMTALIRRTRISDASRGAVDRAMRALGLSGHHSRQGDPDDDPVQGRCPRRRPPQSGLHCTAPGSHLGDRFHVMGEPRPKLRLSSGLAEIPEISPTQVGQSER